MENHGSIIFNGETSLFLWPFPVVFPTNGLPQQRAMLRPDRRCPAATPPRRRARPALAQRLVELLLGDAVGDAFGFGIEMSLVEMWRF